MNERRLSDQEMKLIKRDVTKAIMPITEPLYKRVLNKYPFYDNNADLISLVRLPGISPRTLRKQAGR